MYTIYLTGRATQSQMPRWKLHCIEMQAMQRRKAMWTLWKLFALILLFSNLCNISVLTQPLISWPTSCTFHILYFAHSIRIALFYLSPAPGSHNIYTTHKRLQDAEFTLGDLMQEIDVLKAGQASSQAASENLGARVASAEDDLSDSQATLEQVSAAQEASFTRLDGEVTKVASAVDDTNTVVDALAAASKAADATLTAKVNAVVAKVGDDLQETIKDLSTATAKAQETADLVTNALYGSLLQFPAENCGKIKETTKSAVGGVYFLKVEKEIFQVVCANVKDKFISLGGNGKTKASAAAGCNGNNLVQANNDAEKWIDPDADAENTENAKKVGCVGISAASAAESCGHLVKLGIKKSGTYFVKNGGNGKKVYCDLTTDGGGWVLVGTQKPDGTYVHILCNGKGHYVPCRLLDLNFCSLPKFNVLLSDVCNSDNFSVLYELRQLPWKGPSWLCFWSEQGSQPTVRSNNHRLCNITASLNYVRLLLFRLFLLRFFFLILT